MKKIVLLTFIFIVIFLFLSKNKNILLNDKAGLSNENKENKNSLSNNDGNYNRKLLIGDNEIFVEIADTPEKNIKGLSGREKLNEGYGMLFTYPSERQVSFWMPQMNFSLDIIFIKANKIIQIEKNVPNYPSDYPKEKLPRYISLEPIDMVLEVPAGYSNKNGIDVGDQVELKD